jgi:hypothetical protein
MAWCWECEVVKAFDDKPERDQWIADHRAEKAHSVGPVLHEGRPE